MLLTEYPGTVKSVGNLPDPREPYFTFVISGRTKGNQLSGAKLGVLCIGTTKGTHIQLGRWVRMLVELKRVAGIQGGHLFMRN
jgi:hypothetical protein